MARSGGRSYEGLGTGIVLIVVGAVFLLERFDWLSIGQVWRLWPLIVIGIGLTHLIRSGDGRPSIFLLLVGIWLQVSTLGLWGLDWGDSWPLLIVFVGVSLVFDALVAASRSGRRGAVPAAGHGSPAAAGSGSPAATTSEGDDER